MRVPGFVRRALACFLSRARRLLCLVFAWRLLSPRRRISAPRAQKLILGQHRDLFAAAHARLRRAFFSQGRDSEV